MGATKNQPVVKMTLPISVLTAADCLETGKKGIIVGTQARNTQTQKEPQCLVSTKSVGLGDS